MRDRELNKVLMRVVAGGVVVMMLLLGGVSLANRFSSNRPVDPIAGVEEQELSSLSNDAETLGIETSNSTLLVNGNILTVGELQVSNGAVISTIALTEGANAQTYTLPNSSGVFCLDSNNCGYLQADDVTNTTIAGNDGNFTIGSGLTLTGNELSSTITQTVQTSVNNSTGSITLQGTNNQVTVTKNGNTLTLSGPQDLGVTSSPTFTSISITGTGTQNGNVLCDISNNCGYGGTGSFVQNGNSFGAEAMLGTNDNFGLSFETNGIQRMTILNDGRVGINTATPSEQFEVVGNTLLQGHAAVGSGVVVDGFSFGGGGDTYSVVLNVAEEITTAAEDYIIGTASSLVLNQSADTGSIFIGTASTISTDQANGFDFNDQVIASSNVIYHSGSGELTAGGKAVTALVFNQGAGTISDAWGVHANIINNGTGAIGDINAGSFQAFNLGAGTIDGTVKLLSTQFNSTNGVTDTVYGLQVNSNAGTITNNYGIYIQDQSGAGTSNSFNLYSAGANSINQFEGRLRVADGTAVAPAMAFSADATTGLYYSTNQIGFSVGGTERLRVTSSNALNITGTSGLLQIGGAAALERSTTTLRIGEGFTEVLNRSSAGRFTFGTAGDANLYRVAAGSLRTDGAFRSGGTADAVQMVVSGNASQTLNLQEWRDSTGTALASIAADGDLEVVDATVNGNLVVDGTATFNGNITVNGKIITGNTSGSTTVTVDTAGAGTGASASISGNDTSGVITINTGTGAAAGRLATITFSSAFPSAPNVVITPKAIPGGGTYPQYHFDSATGTFDLSSFNALTDSSTYTFSYFIVD